MCINGFLDKAESLKLNYFACRPPRMEVSMGACRTVIDGITKGFVVSPFKKGNPVTIVPQYRDAEQLADLNPSEEAVADFPFPDKSTSQTEHENGVRNLVEYHIATGGKTVLSSVIVGNSRLTPSTLFSELCLRFPNAFVFIFRTNKAGLWIGASPELLLEHCGDKVSTMALAGTMPSDNIEWDDKNIAEQQMVTDFIADCMKRFAGNVKIADRTTLNAGKVSHLCTPITANLGSRDFNISELLYALSPTPALCGSDYTQSISMIDKYENHRRGYYGGYIGLNVSADYEVYYVNLRSVRMENGRYCVYVGGGITAESVPEKEWEETRRKSRTILDIIDCCK